MSATTPLWFPLVLAAAGPTTTLSAAILSQRWASRREDVRWERERKDRQDQWRREDAQRWLQDRREAYARLLTALDELRDKVEEACQLRFRDAEAVIDLTEIKAGVKAATAALYSAVIVGSEKVVGRAQIATSNLSAFAYYLAPWNKVSTNKLDELMEDAHGGSLWLFEAMREDLGLEIPNLLEALRKYRNTRPNDQP